MRYWWVNQGQTHRHETSGGYLWAPKLDQRGRSRAAYDRMLELAVGDCVFSYFSGAFRAVGVVMRTATECPRPDFGFANSFWNTDGWLVDVEFTILPDPFDPKSRLEDYRRFAPVLNGPINRQGRANMEYLYEIPAELGEIYRRAIQVDLDELRREGADEREIGERADAEVLEIEAIRREPGLGPTEKSALVLSRRGQGYFRREVARLEPVCRLTGVADPRHLRASHIKPWRVADNAERLDGHNGLLLSPHVDHLFDQGYISFSRDGRVITSPRLDPEILRRWSLDTARSERGFSRRQDAFLEYHRDEVLQRA